MAEKNITMICDRGYISERNVKDFDDAGIDFLLMLRKDLSCGEELLKQYSSEIKKRYSKVSVNFSPFTDNILSPGSKPSSSAMLPFSTFKISADILTSKQDNNI